MPLPWFVQQLQHAPVVVHPLPHVEGMLVALGEIMVTCRFVTFMKRALFFWIVLAATVVAQDRSISDPRVVYEKAVDDFINGDFEASADGFDALVELRPDLAPRLWQRGIVLYYAARYDACIAQFELHRTVNPNDVENAAWHFLCVARSESPEQAQSALLPVGPDARVPMRQVYDLYSGAITPDEVMAATNGQPGAVFYAHLYLGLYAEALGDRESALEHIRAAADHSYGRVGRFDMYTVAAVHLALLESRP